MVLRKICIKTVTIKQELLSEIQIVSYNARHICQHVATDRLLYQIYYKWCRGLRYLIALRSFNVFDIRDATFFITIYIGNVIVKTFLKVS